MWQSEYPSLAGLGHRKSFRVTWLMTLLQQDTLTMETDTANLSTKWSSNTAILSFLVTMLDLRTLDLVDEWSLKLQKLYGMCNIWPMSIYKSFSPEKEEVALFSSSYKASTMEHSLNYKKTVNIWLHSMLVLDAYTGPIKFIIKKKGKGSNIYFVMIPRGKTSQLCVLEGGQ